MDCLVCMVRTEQEISNFQLKHLDQLIRMPPLNVHADISRGARSMTFFDLSLHLHPYFVHASSDGYGESAHLCTLR